MSEHDADRTVLYSLLGIIGLMVIWLVAIQAWQNSNTHLLMERSEDRYTGTQAAHDLTEIRDRLDRLEQRRP